MNLQFTGGEEGIQVIENYFVNYSSGEVKHNGIVVECGAAEGFFNPSLTLELIYNWKYFGFEPDPTMFSILSKNRQDAIKINKALSDFQGTSKFYMSAQNGNSSLKHSKFHEQELNTYKPRFSDGKITNEIVVDVVDWQWFIDTYSLSSVDLLILDVEGHELDVFRGIQKTNVFPKVIQAEFVHSDPENRLLDESKKQDFSGFLAIADVLNSMGYLFDYVSSNNAHFSLKEMWIGKKRPINWVDEIDTYSWFGYCGYDKSICKQKVKC